MNSQVPSAEKHKPIELHAGESDTVMHDTIVNIHSKSGGVRIMLSSQKKDSVYINATLTPLQPLGDGRYGLDVTFDTATVVLQSPAGNGPIWCKTEDHDPQFAAA
jgi:hypothetical protein